MYKWHKAYRRWEALDVCKNPQQAGGRHKVDWANLLATLPGGTKKQHKGFAVRFKPTKWLPLPGRGCWYEWEGHTCATIAELAKVMGVSSKTAQARIKSKAVRTLKTGRVHFG